jgi:cytochrome c oxidase assembly factor CtaG
MEIPSINRWDIGLFILGFIALYLGSQTGNKWWYLVGILLMGSGVIVGAFYPVFLLSGGEQTYWSEELKNEWAIEYLVGTFFVLFFVILLVGIILFLVVK